jgi:predicted permease
MTRLAGLSLLLLVIAVLNVGNLLLARGARREREVAVRRALGISRARLALMWMLEALLVAMLAAVAATIVSTMLGGVLRALIMPETKWTPPVADARAILFTSLLAAICTAVCGSLPALRFGGDHAAQWLRAGTRAPDRSTTWLRTGFLVAQAALSAVLLIGAGLFVTSLERVKRVDVGYDLRGLAAVSVMGSFSAQRAALEAASTRLRGLPDVEGTALVTTTPLRGLSGYDTYLPNSDSALGDGVSPDVYGVSPEFFRTAGLTLIRGRPFTAADGRGAPRVIVVSQHMAETLWPGASPIGSCVRFVSSASNCYTVIGVARNARRFRVVEQPVSQAWIAVDQLPDSSGPRSLMIRSRGDVRTAAKLAEDELTGVLGASARPATFFYDTWLDPQLRSWRLGTRLFTGVAVVALALAVIGLYSVLSFSVAQRTRELGVRIALGADVAALVGLVLGQGLRAVVIGLVMGLALAAAAGTLIESLLYDTSLYDPTVYGAVALTLIVAGSMAAAIPAVRAGRVDPAESLRAE